VLFSKGIRGSFAPLANELGNSLRFGMSGLFFGFFKRRKVRLSQFDDPLSDEWFREASFLCKFVEISGCNALRRIFSPEFHGHLLAEFGIVDRADDIVERRESCFEVRRTDAANAFEHREVVAGADTQIAGNGFAVVSFG
jgi:hypothetical protein